MKPVGGSHTVTITFDQDGVDVSWLCHEDNHGPCHWTCGLDCPTWDDGCLREHPRQRVDYCNPIEFIDNDDAYWFEKYVGPPGVEAHSGPVEFVWQPGWESYGWRYADA